MGDSINAWPGIQAWWREYSRWFSEEFANYVNQPQQIDKLSTLYREANRNQ
jgi:hypothetical protein